MSDWRRRDLLGGLGAAALLPRMVAGAAPSPSLRTLLDRLAVNPLAELDASRLGPADAAIYRMVARGMARARALRAAFPFGKADGGSPYLLSHRHGAWLDDPSRLDAETGQLREAAAAGMLPPLFILDQVIAAQRALAPRPGSAPARQLALLESLRAKAPPEAGVWRLPHGAEYYALRLRCTSGSDAAPAALDRQVAAETRALLARADRLLRRLGLSRGGVGARLRALRMRGEYLYSGDEAGRSRAIAGMNAVLHRLRPAVAKWFPPPLALGVGIRAMSPAEIVAGKRGYRDPAGGAYYPDLAAVQDRPSWTLATVACHETIPGHLLQLAHQPAAGPHPLQLKYAAGYSEGWAIYAESAVDRLGLFSPVEQLGFIQSLLFRLARVTADIGIHLHRWDRARALRYLRDTVGFELFFAFPVEVDRYCVEPASFAGDALVALALREMGARTMRGGPAAARRFHRAALDHGPMTAEALRLVASAPAPGSVR